MTDPDVGGALAAAITRQRHTGAVLMLGAAAVLLVGFVLQWMVVTPLNDVAVSVVGPSARSYGPVLFFARPLPQALTAPTFCFPEVPVLVALLVAVTGFAYLTRRRPPVRLDLVVAACAIGLVSVGINLILLQLDGQGFGFYHVLPVFAIDFTWGLWLSLAGYPTALVGCFLVHRRRSEVVSELAA